MDRILVLDENTITSGTYEELLAKPGLFSRLHAFETGIYTDATYADKITFMPGKEVECIHKALHRSPVFAMLNWSLTDILAKSAKQIDFAAEETIIRRGDTGDTMFSIISGEVEINGRTFGPGDSFGEIALFADDAGRDRFLLRCRDVFPLGRSLCARPNVLFDADFGDFHQ